MGHKRIEALLIASMSFVLFGMACGRDAGQARTADGTQPLSVGGVPGDGTVPMRIGEYPLTRDRLEGWRGAQGALDAIPSDPSFVPARIRRASSSDVDRVVAYLDNRPEFRRALAPSGLSVRDYVLTTLALAQAEHARTDGRLAEYNALPADERALVNTYGPDLHRVRRAGSLRIVDDENDQGDDGGEDSGHRDGHVARDGHSEHEHGDRSGRERDDGDHGDRGKHEHDDGDKG